MESPMLSTQEPQSQVKGKGFGIRAGAYIIDVIAIWIISLSTSFIIGIFLGIVLVIIGREPNFASDQMTILNYLIGFVLSTLYFAIFEWLYGATPGKLILGMRVVMDDGKPCTFVAAILRAILRLVDGFFFGLPALSSMKEPLLQRIGDKSAKTIVVDAKDSFIQRPREWWWTLIALGIYLGIDTVMTVIQAVGALR